MSDFKVRFRDQQTGRQIEVEADRLKKTPSARTADESFKTSKVGDGKVDILIKEKGWWNDTHSHLGIKTENLSKEDAAALKRALENPGTSGLSVMKAWGGFSSSGVSVIKTDAAGELAAPTPNLDTTGTRRPVQLTPSGQVATPEGREPQTLKESGDGLFRMASLIDDVKGNLFDQIQAPAALKEKTFNHLKETLAAVAPGKPLPSGIDDKQALQLRSSAATSLLELMTAKQDTPASLRQQAFDTYTAALKVETNPLLKDSMALNLDRLRGSLPSSFQPAIDQTVKTSAPVEPPYDKWFANGNDTVKIDWSCGSGEGFLEDNVKNLEQQGFKKVAGSSDHAPVMEKTFVKNGVETKFEVRFRTDRQDMFDKVDDKDTHMVIYSGHSNWGRNVRDSLRSSPEASGDGKLIMTNLCVGKGELQQMKDKFPDAHVITTYNSGYFRPGSDAEWHYAANSLFEGIAQRRGYQEIADDVRDTNAFRWNHQREGVDNNFVFPSDLKTRRQVLDQDHDGQADVFDRMVNFNTFDVPTDTAREFQAIQPHRPADDLVGTKVHFAAMSTNRVSLYNEILGTRNSKAEVLPGGFFQPSDTDKGLFRFQRDGQNVSMEMNAKFSHMSEEALRMAAAFEYNQFKATDDRAWPLSNNKVDTILHGLVFASQSLATDSGHRDNAVWGEFLKAYNLPDISLASVATARDVEHHYYSGSKASVAALKQTLSPAALEALSRAEAGILGR